MKILRGSITCTVVSNKNLYNVNQQSHIIKDENNNN
jgi:hypothetical protein